MIGIITAVDSSGVGIITELLSKTKHPFTFDCVEGYCGQPPKEAGLVAGASVFFKLDDTIVTEVKVL